MTNVGPMPDLPWAPAQGQTALRVIERTEAMVLCEDKGNPFFRYLYTADGKCLSIGGQSLTLKARVMKPAPEDLPPEPEPPPARPVEPPRAPVIASAAKQSIPVQMSLF